MRLLTCPCLLSLLSSNIMYYSDQFEIIFMALHFSVSGLGLYDVCWCIYIYTYSRIWYYMDCKIILCAVETGSTLCVCLCTVCVCGIRQGVCVCVRVLNRSLDVTIVFL